MSSADIRTVFDIATWFFKRADKDDVYLNNDKLQHLMFLSQIHFALTNNNNHLFYGTFICTPQGFEEPNLAQILKFGLPLIETTKFDKHINNFLDLIWQKYFPLSANELSTFIKNSDSYIDSYNIEKNIPLHLEELCHKFKSNLKKESSSLSSTSNKQKVLISQNGPVVVSQWQPRKVNSANIKEK